jgi:hypothetical protein
VLLPTDWKQWSDAERRAVLAHELAHIRRGDFAVHLTAQVCALAHFVNPVVHLLSESLRLDQELEADDRAAALCGGNTAYMTALAGLAIRPQGREPGWPARGFVPTRGMFLRRLEMLRFQRPGRIAAGQFVRGLTAAAVVVGGLAVTTLAPSFTPTGLVAGPAPLAQEKGEVADTLRFVRPGTLVFLHFNLEAARKNPAFASLVNLMVSARGVPPVPGIDPATIKSVDFVMGELRGEPVVVIRAPIQREKLAGLTIRKVEGLGEIIDDVDGRMTGVIVEDGLMVFGPKEPVLMTIASKTRNEGFETALKGAAGKVAFGVFDGDVLRKMRGEPQGAMLAIAGPIIDKAKNVSAVVDVEGGVSATLSATMADEASVAAAKDTAGALLTLARNGLSELEQRTKGARIPASEAAMTGLLTKIGQSLLKSAKVDSAGTKVEIVMKSDISAAAFAELMGPGVMAARTAARRGQSQNNLKQIGLAIHNFESAYRRMPPAASTEWDGKKLQHPVSWRVLILPFIEQDALFRQYNFDEPWDGPNNSKLLAKMPPVYGDPAGGSKSETRYLAITGKGATFDGDKKGQFAQITDGLSNTIGVVEAANPVPWLKPDDLDIEKAADPANLGNPAEPNIFQVLILDGSVRAVSKKIDLKVLRALLTSAGGEVIDPNGL